MSKQNRNLILIGLLGTVISMFFLTQEPRKKDPVIYLPLADEKSYTDKVNQWIIEKKQAADIAENTKTPEKAAKEKSFRLRLISSAEAAVRDVEFYGRIVDQYGDPVPGVLVKYKALSQFLVAGTGFGEVMSDNNGRFNTEGAEGVGLSIREFIKPGYQFPGKQNFGNFKRFEHTVLWKDYSEDKPYVFTAWKVARYAKVNTGGTTFGYDLDTVYSMDFTARHVQQVKKKGALDLDLQVKFHHSDSGWTVNLFVPNGGLIETEDFYQNLAPEEGYQQEVIYSGKKENHVVLEKKYYIHSRGELYGSLTAEIRPYYRDKSAISFSYVVNMEKGRDLAVKK